jgi:adenylate kinase family enzyme
MIPKRILVLGMSGAGKSTLAHKLGLKFNLPVTHLDNMAHHPGWTMKTDTTIRRSFQVLANQPKWVANGNYFRLSTTLRKRAELIIFLDFGTLYCLQQILRRYVLHKLGLQRRKDLAAGFDDAITWPFLQWVWRWRRDNRRKWAEELKNYPSQRVKIFTTRRDLNRWLKSL